MFNQVALKRFLSNWNLPNLSQSRGFGHLSGENIEAARPARGDYQGRIHRRSLQVFVAGYSSATCTHYMIQIKLPLYQPVFIQRKRKVKPQTIPKERGAWKTVQ